MSLRERLENNNLPLGMLTDEEIQELITAEDTLLFFSARGKWLSLYSCFHVGGDKEELATVRFRNWFGHNCIIRIKKRPVVKPSIDWSHVSREYNKIAIDQDGRGWLYATEVKLKCQKSSNRWVVSAGPSYAYIRADCFASYLPGNCDWKDSLVTRPQES